MSAHKMPLDDYPALAAWYSQHATRPVTELSGQLVLRTCEALRREPTAAARLWMTSFTDFLGNSAAPLKDFLAAEEIVHRCNVELLDVIGDIGEAAVKAGSGDDFFQTMQQGAEVTGLIVFRFLSAWTALNTGRLEDCVDECEKVNEPFSSVHTIHGQALLELGRPAEAIEVLDVATKLSPGELLAWFQKAKALHVTGRGREAIACLKECRRLAPQSDEVAVYQAMIAVETPAAVDLWAEAWAVLAPHLGRLGSISTVALVTLRLAALLDDKSKAELVLGTTTWNGNAQENDVLQALTSTLRLLGQRGWMDVAATLLGRVTPAGEAC